MYYLQYALYKRQIDVLMKKENQGGFKENGMTGDQISLPYQFDKYQIIFLSFAKNKKP